MVERAVYDLGDLDYGVRSPSTARAPSAPLRAHNRVHNKVVTPRPTCAGPDLLGTLSIFLPGTEQLFRGQTAKGLGIIATLGFLVSLFWATLDTLTRLTATLGLLGYRRELALWGLGALYGTACLLHLIAVLDAARDRGEIPRRAYPALSVVASLLVPGWGQLLNGNRKRAAGFLGGLWLVAAAWILVSPPARELLQDQAVYLPRWLELFSSAATRWVLPAVLWSLAAYDAASRSARRS